MSLIERLTRGVTSALTEAGLPAASDCAWDVPRHSEHGDYATNAAMTLARAAVLSVLAILSTLLVIKNIMSDT